MTAERPTFSECVIGYRTWKLADWVLAPVSYGHPWRPGVNEATCKAGERSNMGLYLTTASSDERLPGRHAAPQQDCTCGLHAYHEVPENRNVRSYDGARIVAGAVAAWGDLQVHHNGFRAERAQIVALVEEPGLQEVAGIYGVPLVPRPLLAAEAQRHGTQLPDSLRPSKPPPHIEITLNLNQAMGSLHKAFQVWANGPIGLSIGAPVGSGVLWTPDDESGKTPAEKLPTQASGWSAMSVRTGASAHGRLLLGLAVVPDAVAHVLDLVPHVDEDVVHRVDGAGGRELRMHGRQFELAGLDCGPRRILVFEHAVADVVSAHEGDPIRARAAA